MTPLQNLPRNVGDLGKLIAAKGFKKLPKDQKIAKSGHTDRKRPLTQPSRYHCPINKFWSDRGAKVSVLAFYLTIRVRIPLKSTVIFVKFVFEKNEIKQKEAGSGPFKKQIYFGT